MESCVSNASPHAHDFGVSLFPNSDLEDAMAAAARLHEKGNLLRTAGWSGVAVVLLAPLIAMRFTDEVNWTAFDFAFAGVLLVGAGLLLELIVWQARRPMVRAGLALVVVAAVLLIWADGAVGLF